MSVRLGEVELKPEVESQVQSEGENQQIAPEKKKFSFPGGGGHEFRGLFYLRAHRVEISISTLLLKRLSKKTRKLCNYEDLRSLKATIRLTMKTG